MGRLYDRQDLTWNTLFWQRKEAQLSIDIAEGRIGSDVLNSVISYPSKARVRGENGHYLPDDVRPTRHMRLKDIFAYEIQKERFKLLRTGQLLANLKAWEAIFKACPNCHQEVSRKDKDKTIDRPCTEHEEGYRKSRSDVWWAGERNVADREARGQKRHDETPAPAVTGQDEAFLKSVGIAGLADEPQNPLNKWEMAYQRDKAEGAWPLTVKEQRLYDVENSYKGWLNKLLQDEELTEKEYLDELQRLRAEASELENTTRPVAGTNAKVKRDSRHNQLSN